MPPSAAAELAAEHRRIVLRVVQDVMQARAVRDPHKIQISAYRKRVSLERQFAAALEPGLLGLTGVLDLDGAIALAHRLKDVQITASRWPWRKQASNDPNANEVRAQLTQAVNEASLVSGAMQIYLGMAQQISEEAGGTSLQHLGLGKTWAWAHPQNMARDLFQVRGSKVIQQAYGNHIDRLRDIILRATDPANPMTVQQVRAQILEEWPAITRSQAERIARTETAALWTHTSAQAYSANGITQFASTLATGPSIGIESEDPCDICIDAAEAVHTMDDDLPPWHPNCRCEAVPVLEDGEGGEWLPPDDAFDGGGDAVIEGTEEADDAPETVTTLSSAPEPGWSANGVLKPGDDLGDALEEDLRASIWSANNRMSGLKNRIKSEFERPGRDEVKLADLRQRLAVERDFRDRMKAALEGRPPPPPSPPLPISPPPPQGDVYSLERFLNAAEHTSGQPVKGKVEVWRVGKPRDTYGRGVFFGDSPTSVEGYASLHADEEVTRWVVDVQNAAVYDSQADAYRRLFGKNLNDAIYDWERRNPGKTSTEAFRAQEKRIAAKLRMEGYDAVVYRAPPAPAKYELAIITKKPITNLAVEEPPVDLPVEPPLPDLPPDVTPDEIRARVTSANNRISGIKTRIKRLENGIPGRVDPDGKLPELRQRLASEIEERDRLKQLLVDKPPPPPPLVEPPVSPPPARPVDISADSWNEARFEQTLRGHIGKTVRVTWEGADGKIFSDFGVLEEDGGYLTIGGKTLGNGSNVRKIEAFDNATREYVTVAEDPRPPQYAKPDSPTLPSTPATTTGVPSITSTGDTPLARQINALKSEISWAGDTTLEEARMKKLLDIGEVMDDAIRDGIDPEIRYAASDLNAEYNRTAQEWNHRLDPLKDKSEKLRQQLINQQNTAARAEGYEAWRNAPWGGFNLSDLERAKLDRLRNDPLVKEIEAESRAAQEAEWALRAEKQRALAEVQTRLTEAERKLILAEREATLAKLNDIRVMGGTDAGSLRFVERMTGTKNRKKVEKALRQVEQFLPRDWLDRMKPIDGGSARRGFHSNRLDWTEIKVSWSDSKLGSAEKGHGTALHELGHEVEATNSLVARMEKAFYEYRTRGETAKRIPGYAKDEVGRADGFNDPYMGKDYNGRYYELLTMGLEALWRVRSSAEMDLEMRRFILGLMSVA